MLRVRDIMTRRVVSLPADATIETAAWRFATDGVTGAPVRDPQGNVIGVLSRSDLGDPIARAEPGTRVEDAMTPCAWAVTPDAPALDAVRLMLEKQIHRVLVVSAPRKIDGILTTTDVLRAITRGFDFCAPG